MVDPLPLRIASPDQQRAEIILLGPDAAAVNENLRRLQNHSRSKYTVVENLEDDLKQRLTPHQKRKAEIRASIELLEKLEGEVDDIISGIEREAAPAIRAAEMDYCAADAEYWDAWKAARK